LYRRLTERRRVAVTGIGLVSAIGVGREAVWSAMLNGACGIRPLSLFEAEGCRSLQVAELPAYVPAASFSSRSWDRLSRSDQIAVIASHEALDDAGVLSSGIDPTRIGVMFGSGTADLLRNEEWFLTAESSGIRRAPASKIFGHFPTAPSDTVASHFGLDGVRSSVLSACSSSTVAIGYAGDAIALGQADAMLAGAADALCRLTLTGFNALRLVDVEPCRPFCRTRKGMNIGEAAAVLVLEEMSHATKRGAKIYAELAGYGVRCEAYHATAPEPEGIAVAALVGAALESAGVSTDDIDHVNAHGTATPQNDQAEARGLRRVFGDRVRQIPVTSIKSMVGHCLSAAGAIEAATLAMTIARGVIPPTIHHRELDPECPIELVAHHAREARVACGVSTSLAFGGNDAALVMRKV
jgi:3-oxoacyl-[acyl-carrier-protein] synthase II